MSYVGFKKLSKMISKNPKVDNPEAVASSQMHNKYKESDIKKHQQSGTSMKNVTPKKGYGK